MIRQEPGSGVEPWANSRNSVGYLSLHLDLTHVALILMAFGFRLQNLGTQSFWWDEAYSAVVSRLPIRQIVEVIVRDDFHPPLHYLVFHYWMRLAGEGEFALRLVSV
ncbi:MAG TPA: hypothetical protein VMP10_01155, partial [Chloroflexota bacterium]|nr:hypothetical protein [Chloroflexota bacterium]